MDFQLDTFNTNSAKIRELRVRLWFHAWLGCHWDGGSWDHKIETHCEQPPARTTQWTLNVGFVSAQVRFTRYV